MKKPTATSDNTFKAGDVVVVPFPYADMRTEKRRPALVVSNTTFNQKHDLVWVVMITSAEHRTWPDDIDVPLSKTGLTAASRIRTAKLATIDVSRIIRKAGSVDKSTRDRCLQKLAGYLEQPKSE